LLKSSASNRDNLRTNRGQTSNSTDNQRDQGSQIATRTSSGLQSKTGGGGDLLGTFDFEPALNFDDLHTNLTSESPQLGPFSTPAVGGTLLARQDSGTVKGSRQRNDTSEPIAGAGGPRFGSDGSVLRRQSIVAKQNSGPANTSMDPPTGTLPLRSRRQSHFPPPTATNPVARAPRKSIGPGVIDSDFAARAAHRRRPSLASNNDTMTSANHDFARSAARISVSGGALGDKPGFLTTSRNVKTKSLQPPPRSTTNPNTLYAPSMTPDHNRSSSIGQARSPGKSPGRGTNTPSSSSKRLSVMPAHAMSGLGARTISPTDARRMKRLSTLPNPPPMPNTPPTPQPEGTEIRSAADSPLMIPRKSVTPSSSRTTPEQNRKSYSSGLSTSSNASLNSLRNTNLSTVQPRQNQSSLTSRLPTPKTRNVHSSAGGDEEEEVPPVPAIPKAYESPKDFGDSQFTISRKSSLKFEPTSSANTSGGEHDYASFRRRDQLSVDRETRLRRGQTIAISSDAEKKTRVPPTSNTKNLQPLRLPPLNLLPLSTPTISKVAALQDHSAANLAGNVTPPQRDNIKTPATPLTAPKATFFTRSRKESESTDQTQHGRSNSTTLAQRSESLHQRIPSTASSMAPPPAYSKHDRQAQSPFISSSLPKSNGDYQFSRPNTSGEYTPVNTSAEPRSSRLNGPRAQTSVKSSKDDAAPQSSSPSERETPTSTTSSIRRKLSIGWKRSSSKNSQAATDRDAEYPPQGSKHDDMPPPRLPSSATWTNGLASSPSPIAKATSHFEKRRRKSSASSLNALATKNDTTENDTHTWATKKESVDNLRGTPSSSRSTSILAPMHKMLNSKSSNGTLKSKITDSGLDRDDQAAEDEMKKLASKRKDFELAANEVDDLRKRATPKDGVTPTQAVRIVTLNIFERGEIVDYKEVFFCGTKDAKKHVGDLNAQSANFGYDDDRGDYNIVEGDHLSYRYEIVDILGKGSFGQVVRCVDHKTGGLVAVKIIRNKKRFHQQALVEVNILQKLREWVCIYLAIVRSTLLIVEPRTRIIGTVWSTLLRASTSVATYASRPSSSA
jgi:dual specificity tyrosine-phosphorylation-regulated kinase 2/3/4